MPLQQAQEFLLKRRLAMMFFLILDVGRHRGHFDPADRERAVPFLPAELKCGKRLVNPF